MSSKSHPYPSFLLQSLICLLDQLTQTAELMLELKNLSFMSVLCSTLLHLQATAGITHQITVGGGLKRKKQQDNWITFDVNVQNNNFRKNHLFHFVFKNK